SRQEPPADSLQVKRAWGEALTPFGMILAGRMGVHWGLGLVANDGSCLDCEHGDTVDGIGLVLPLLGHALGVAYDIAASGPNLAAWGEGGQPLDLDPADDVRSVSVALLRYNAPAVRRILLAGGRNVVDYGLVWSHRWQRLDFPGWTGAAAGGGSGGGEDGAAGLPAAGQAVPRAFSGDLLDGWLRWESPRQSLELELVLLVGRIGDASLVPGLHTVEVRALQYGGVVRETVRPTGWLELSFELGLASGDAAPGFGARPGRERDRSRPGDLDGPQLQLPHDTRVDNLRFHPDYHVDLILWRELVGTVTDALYLRPRLQLGPWAGFTLEGVVVYSQALEAASAPGGKEPLGLETDLALRYRSRDGFVAGLQYGLLVPLAGLDNVELGLEARVAQRLHGLVGFVF
ncbi:MAG: TIGR04551 family protein, partial [Deltaproteobacteria bacterium]|nr:TIGR04551 family protein [Deltaproteobacteria bacterium]